MARKPNKPVKSSSNATTSKMVRDAKAGKGQLSYKPNKK